MTCSLPDCDLPVLVKRDQLCSPHYQQKKNGRPFTKPRQSSLTRDERGRKRCRSCDTWLELSAFVKESRSADGLSTYCYPCRAKYERDRIEIKRDRVRARNMNMTRDQFDAMFAAQGNRCAICRTDSPGSYHYWCVDHDHTCCPQKARSCGKCIRGILCPACNKGIGLLGDDASTLYRAASYLADSLAATSVA